jgi:hypothetical protein
VDLSAVAPPAEFDRRQRQGKDAALHSEQPGHGVDGLDEATLEVGQGRQHEVVDGMPGKLALTNR